MLHPIRTETSSPSLAAVEAPAYLSPHDPDEGRRWAVLLTLPVLIAAAFIGLAIGTPFTWLFAGAVLIGPFGVVTAIAYLAMTTDTNGRIGRPARVVTHPTPLGTGSDTAHA